MCSRIFVLICLCRRDVVACIGLPDGDPSWERSFSRWPLGVCDYLVPVRRRFHPEEWAQRTRNLYNWSEPHNRCKQTESSPQAWVQKIQFLQYFFFSFKVALPSSTFCSSLSVNIMWNSPCYSFLTKCACQWIEKSSILDFFCSHHFS